MPYVYAFVLSSCNKCPKVLAYLATTKKAHDSLITILQEKHHAIPYLDDDGEPLDALADVEVGSISYVIDAKTINGLVEDPTNFKHGGCKVFMTVANVGHVLTQFMHGFKDGKLYR